MSFWTSQILAAFFVSYAMIGNLMIGNLRGQSPEPLPPYASATPMRDDATLRAVAFRPGSGDVGIACGDRGTLLRTTDGGQSWHPEESGVDCSLSDVVWANPQRVVVVGGSYDRITQLSRGIVLYSDDGGEHWHQAAETEISRIHSVELRDDGVLVANCDLSHSLLTRDLESRDGGRTWHALVPDFQEHQGPRNRNTRSPSPAELYRWSEATGTSAPIRDACRTDAGAICAVGDHGVITVSTDRGQTWRAVRGDKRHAAILIVASSPTAMAWSLLGSETLENRHRVALLVDDDREAEDGAQVSSIALSNQVAVMLGGSGADALRSDDGDQLAQAANSWVGIHRPAIVVLDSGLPADVQDAFFQAATANGVSRVLAYSLEGRGSISLHRDAMLTQTGILASDLCADAMHYVAPRHSAQASIATRTLYDVATHRRQDPTIMGGISLEEGQRLTANIPRVSRRQLQIVQARLRQSERIESLIHKARSSDQFSESLALTLDQTAKEDQFRLAWTILMQTHAANVPGLYDIVLDQIAGRFPSMSAGRWAALRRDSIRHSLEWRRLRTSLGGATDRVMASRSAESVPVSPFQVSASGVQQASAISPLVVPKPETHDLTIQEAKADVEVDLNWEFHPLVLIGREAARSRGDAGQLQIAGDGSADLQRLADTAEGTWAALLRSRSPQVIVARRTPSPPKLDGIIDDPCWQSALSSAGRSPQIRLAYDEEYLYIAAQCDAGSMRPDARWDHSRSMVRDEELSDVDRLSLWIDIDRDLMTSMQLQVSEAGRTHDAIDGNPAWQPTWYVDTRSTEDQVAIEIAILRRDVVDLPITVGESWFISGQITTANSETDASVVPDPSRWMRVDFQQ